MAHKIAYLKSADFSHRSPIDDFQDFAKSRGIDFEIDRISLDPSLSSDASVLKQYDALMVQGRMGHTSGLLDDIARNLGLVTKCCFKTDFSNLTTQNQIFVTCISPKTVSEYRTTSKLGREAFESSRHTELDIERATRHAYEFSEDRSQRLTLLYLSNASVVTHLWNKVVSDVNEDYPSVRLEVENCFEHSFGDISGKDYDVILMPSDIFDGLSQVTDKKFDVPVGTSPIAYLGDTSVGMYGTENPTVYSPLFDAVAIGKMLACSFDLPTLAKDWDDQIAKVYCKNN